MSESNIGLNADGAGKKVRTLKRTIGADEVHEEVHNVADGAGNVVDPRKNLEVTASALPSGASTEATLALIKAKTDNVDVALSTRALESGGNLATIAGKDFATQTTLALVKAKTDNLDVALSTVAKETTLGTVHGHVDSIDGKMTACNTGAIAGSLTQSTKHDSKVYVPAVFDSSSSGTLKAAVANKVCKLHAIVVQAQGTVVVNINNGSGGSSLMEFSLQAREGIVLPLAPNPAYWAITSQNTILYVTLSAAVTVTITAIVSSDDAS